MAALPTLRFYFDATLLRVSCELLPLRPVYAKVVALSITLEGGHRRGQRFPLR